VHNPRNANPKDRETLLKMGVKIKKEKITTGWNGRKLVFIAVQ